VVTSGGLADEIQVVFLSVEFQGEAARIALRTVILILEEI